MGSIHLKDWLGHHESIGVTKHDSEQACVDACTDAYARALSAFSSGPWERGEVP